MVLQFVPLGKLLRTLKMIILLFAFNLFYFGSCNSRPDIPYMLNFDSAVYECADEESKSRVDTSGVEVRSYNETVSTMSGIIRFFEKIDIDTMVEIIVEKEVSGQFEVVVTHEICSICDEFRPDSPYNKYLKFFGFPDSCPFEPGEYEIYDFVPDSDDLPINSATAARYQASVILYKNPDSSCKNEKTFMFCLKLDFIIEPCE